MNLKYNTMIKAVITSNIFFTTKSEEENVPNNLVLITDCKITQTSYGSVIIERDKHSVINELYPSKIDSVIHYKESKS